MTRLFMLPVLVALVAACGDSHPVSIDFPSPDVGISAATVGAFVLNRGNGQPSATDPCNFREFLTWDVTNIQSPSGTQMLSSERSTLRGTSASCPAARSPTTRTSVGRLPAQPA
jgi:hypothetical protein